MKYIFLIIALFLYSCSAEKKADAETIEKTETPENSLPIETTSFTGQPLYQNVIPEKLKHKNDSIIAALRAKESLTEQDFIELSRKHASNYHYNESIKILTEGLTQFPVSFKLLRHRGHRYLNLRKTEKAIADLTKADKLIGTEHLDVEELGYDGKPWGTYKYWVYYHIGLYHYVKGDYAKAAEAYKVLVANATTDKNQVGSRDWLYNTYRRMGEPVLAQEVLDQIPDDFEMSDTNYVYYKRLLFYKEVLEEKEIFDKDKTFDEWGGGDMTPGYAVASNYLYNGDTATAQQIYNNILRLPFWGAWAYVVTDAEQGRK